MKPFDTNTPPIAQARLAGALYLAIIVLGLWSELFARGALIVAGDPATTAWNLANHPGLLRGSLAADTVMAMADVALAVLLYRLLLPAGRTLALMAMTFRLIQSAIIGMNLLSLNTALVMVDGSLPFDGHSVEQMDALAFLALETQGAGYDLGLVFFGVNSILTGALLIRSGYFPKLLGAAMCAAGLVYLTGSSLVFLAPGLVEWFAPAYGVTILAESAFCLWLLGRGFNRARWPQTAGLPA